MDEEVDILTPPLFKPTGKTKMRTEAYRDGDWIGTFNLWIFSRTPKPSIIYQQRSPNATWAPNLLDVTAGGHLQAGEKFTEGLREVKEELGKEYAAEDVTFLGHKLFVGFNTDGTSHNNIIDVCMIEDSSDLTSYNLEEDEVHAICACPVEDLLKAHRDESYSFDVQALTAAGKEVVITVNKHSFPENWDNYHHKIALLADRYFRGETDLIY